MTRRDFRPEPGDLLFQRWLDGALGAAVCSVTQGVEGAAVSHVAVAVDTDRVVEAAPGEGVVETRLAEFLGRSLDAGGRPAVWVARLREPWLTHAAASAVQARERLGLPYNAAFQSHGPGLYCSQLVYECYRDGEGRPLFDLRPMTFRTADGETGPGWMEYFRGLGVGPPEGVLGTNPGLLSRSAKLAIVHRYGALRA